MLSASVAVQQFDRNQIEKILEAACHIGLSGESIANRRSQTLKVLMELFDAEFGYWAWGRGNAKTNGVFPVAMIAEGFDEQQHATFVKMALDPETDRTFRKPILQLLGSERQATVRRVEVFDDASWQTSKMRSYLNQIGGDEWIQTVRYATLDTWANLYLMRTSGIPGFEISDVVSLDIAMTSVPWLHSKAIESLHSDALVGITPRQATVMLMVLDGYSRKMIAARLGVGLDTVGDHVKAIYRHFGISSVGELAALFLRNE